MVNSEDIERLLGQISQKSNHTEFVIMGSLSILGQPAPIPLGMMASNDVDLYLKNDPERSQGVSEFGEDSEFHEVHGYYADKVSPKMPSLPERWEERLIPIKYDNGVTALFLDPNDCAISKYMRGNDNDLRWIRQGLDAKILDVSVIKERINSVTNCLDGELKKAKVLIEVDVMRQPSPAKTQTHKHLL
ncbi:MAG: DUF6036 family nucleotidyltransferase [Fluviibacter sp.]